MKIIIFIVFYFFFISLFVNSSRIKIQTFPIKPIGDRAAYCHFSCQFNSDRKGICSCKKIPIIRPTRCHPVTCQIKCKYGWQKENGCPICACRSKPPRITTDPRPTKCGKITCRRYCKYGYEFKTRFGCPICACRSKPPRITTDPRPTKCRNTTCKRYCRYGFEMRNGCTICSCKSKPKCLKPRCPMMKLDCEYGIYRPKDRNGCAMCPRCKPKPRCYRVTCKIKCKYGWKKENGCSICACASKPKCPILKCPRIYRLCRYGSYTPKDRNGCPKCPICEAGPLGKCRRVTCKMKCRYGWQIRNGCPICACKKKPKCPILKCPRIYRLCRYGRYTPKDRNGCPMCSECKSKPKCPMYHCKPCRWGSKPDIIDKRGCSRCGGCRKKPPVEDPIEPIEPIDDDEEDSNENEEDHEEDHEEDETDENDEEHENEDGEEEEDEPEEQEEEEENDEEDHSEDDEE